MHLVCIVCDHVLDQPVHELLARLQVDRHVKVDRTQGSWREKHLCTHVWPGEYHTILTTVPEAKLPQLKEGVAELRDAYPADEIWAWALPGVTTF
jgi:hypothetical protein